MGSTIIFFVFCYNFLLYTTLINIFFLKKQQTKDIFIGKTAGLEEQGALICF